MHTTHPLHPWLPLLRQLYPPSAIVHVGAGFSLADSWHQGWADTTQCPIHLLEANEERYQALTAVAENNTGYTVHHLLAGDTQDEEATFYTHSSTNESGLLPAETLAPLWRNLRATGSQPRPQTTLDAFARSLPQHHPAFNWLHLDCLPAARLAAGASALLHGCDVVIARAVLQPDTLAGQGATLAELDAVLVAYGLRLLTVVEENNPALGQALYVRDYPAQLQASHAQSEAQRQQLAKVGEAHKTEIAAKAQLLQKHEQLAQAQKALEAENSQKIKALEQTLQQCEALTQEKNQLSTRLEQTTQVQLQTQQKTEQLAQALHALEVENAKTAKTLELVQREREALESENTKKNQTIQQLQQQIQSLQTQQAQHIDRQQRMQEEMLRAEAQLDLIKDMLLQDTRP